MSLYRVEFCDFILRTYQRRGDDITQDRLVHCLDYLNRGLYCLLHADTCSLLYIQCWCQVHGTLSSRRVGVSRDLGRILSLGYIETRLNASRNLTDGVQAWVDRKSLGRSGIKQECIGFVVLLVSTAGSFMTGLDLEVDGRQTFVCAGFETDCKNPGGTILFLNSSPLAGRRLSSLLYWGFGIKFWSIAF